MYCVIKGADHPERVEQRSAARAAHLQRLQAPPQEGRLLVAGPTPAPDQPGPGLATFSGRLIVAQFESLPAAERWVKDDTGISGDAADTVTVERLRKRPP